VTPGPRARRAAEIVGIVIVVLGVLLLAAIVLGILAWATVAVWSQVLA
jgi:hypothetical protein